jgi:glycosyltransferase involved in cell wall biosynthesis
MCCLEKRVKKKTSVILPTRNEEQIIEETVTSIIAHLNEKRYDYEIIVVLNGSTDRTESIIDAIRVRNVESLKVVTSDPGYGHALRKGLEIAEGDYIVIYNVDFYDLELINLIDINMYGKDLIIGSKRTYWSNDKRPLSRKIITRLFNIFLKVMYDFKGSDTHGIKLLKRKVITEVYPKCITNSGIFDTEFVIRTQWAGFKIADFPVDILEKRPSRFPARLIQTPEDIYKLYKALKKGQ